MAAEFTVFLFAMSLGFAMGFSAAEGSICAVGAARQLVFGRDPRQLIGFALASGVAGLACLPLAWVIGRQASLPPDSAISAPLIAGAILLAIGSLLNGACLLGTLSRISTGEIRYLALPFGLTAGFAMFAYAGIDGPQLHLNMFARAGPLGFILVSVSAFAVLAAWIALRFLGDAMSDGRWRLRVSMALIGLAGSLLFIVTPGWTYADAVRRETAQLTGGIMDMQAILAPTLTALATVFGALISGLKSGRFRVDQPQPSGLARSFGGGVLMAVGATLIPGGNDALLLWSVPGGSVSGLVAYTVMSLLIVIAHFGKRILRDQG